MTLSSVCPQTTKIVNGFVTKTHHVMNIPLTLLMVGVFSVDVTHTSMPHPARRVTVYFAGKEHPSGIVLCPITSSMPQSTTILRYKVHLYYCLQRHQNPSLRQPNTQQIKT